MEGVSTFFIPGLCRAICTLISPDVDKLVFLTAAYLSGDDFDDVEVLKCGPQVIRVYRAVCVVLASSSPMSRVFSEPNKIMSWNQIRLPVGSITADCT